VDPSDLQHDRLLLSRHDRSSSDPTLSVGASLYPQGV
jgi:hypothetical protein